MTALPLPTHAPALAPRSAWRAGIADLLRRASMVALAVLVLTALVECLGTRGPTALVLHPLYLATLLPAALLAVPLVARLRRLRALHAVALVAATLALQLLLLLAGGLAASLVLTLR